MEPSEKVKSQSGWSTIDLGGLLILIAAPLFWFLIPAVLHENGFSLQLSMVTAFEASLLKYANAHKLFVLLVVFIVLLRAATVAYQSARKTSPDPTK